MLFVIADPILIKSAVVVRRDFINEETQVANSFTAFLSELEMRVYVCFTAIAPERPVYIFVVYFGNALKTIL